MHCMPGDGPRPECLHYHLYQIQNPESMIEPLIPTRRVDCEFSWFLIIYYSIAYKASLQRPEVRVLKTVCTYSHTFLFLSTC